MVMDTRLLEACMSGDEQSLQALIQHDPLILDRAATCCEETPLHVAALRGHLNLVKELIRRKPKLASEADAAGCVPLHLASAEGSAEVVRELLRANAEHCSARDHGGRTPLHLGVMKGRLDVVRELIRVCPESASERLDRGETVFHLAIKYCRLDVIKLLVELLKNDHPELLVATDDEGNTVLHFAAFFKQIQTVRYLVSVEDVKGIANAINGNGHTALDVMEKSPRDFNSFEIMETLTQVGIRRGINNPTILLHSLPPTSTYPALRYTRTQSRAKRWYLNALTYLVLKYQTNWIADAHGNLMVVATVIASMSFQAGINPPGGVWQADTIDNSTCTKPGMCRAGTAVFKDTYQFRMFYSYNTWALMAAVGVILLHFGGFPLKNKVGTWVMTLISCLMLHNILGAFVASMAMVVAPDTENETLWHITDAWKYMLLFIGMVHATHIWYWLLFEKLRSFLSPDNVLCRRKGMLAVPFTAMGLVSAYVLLVWVPSV